MSSSNWYLLMIGAIFIAVIAFVFGTIVFGYDEMDCGANVTYGIEFGRYDLIFIICS